MNKHVRPIKLAVVMESFITARMLYHAGCDMNYVHAWKKYTQWKCLRYINR